MTKTLHTRAQALDSPSVDAFSRWRVSDPVTLFDTQFQYDKQPFVWEEWVTGSGLGTHLPNESAVSLSTGSGTSGHSCDRQTYEYIRYQPGKSQLVLMTGVMGAKKAGVRQRIGAFDASNGLFFEQDEDNLKVVRRSFTSGAALDYAVNQNDWNIDRMDGTGPSGVTLDMTKTHIFVIDFQWLGVGRVRFGFDLGGSIYYVHEMVHANVLTAPYITTANLPLHYQITNTGAASGATTMKQICASVQTEGGFAEDRFMEFSMNRASVGVTTRRAVLSIRPGTLNSITFRGKIIPDIWQAVVATNDALVEIVMDPVFTTGAGALTWSAVDSTYSGVQFSTHADANNGAFTGGYSMERAYVTAGSGATRNAASREMGKMIAPLTFDRNGANPRALSIVVTSVSGTTNVSSTLHWKEIR